MKDESNPDAPEYPGIEDKSFESFWNLYDKKVGKSHVLMAWQKLSTKDRAEVLSRVEAYVLSTPDKLYRLNPFNYLTEGRWNDEIVQPQKKPFDNKMLPPKDSYRKYKL